MEDRNLDDAALRQQLLQAVLDKAMGGDLRSVQFVLEQLGEHDRVIRVEWDEGLEELAK